MALSSRFSPPQFSSEVKQCFRNGLFPDVVSGRYVAVCWQLSEVGLARIELAAIVDNGRVAGWLAEREQVLGG